MYIDIYLWDVANEMKSGKIVCCTDRQKGDTFYLNGLTAQEYYLFMDEAMRDQTNRFKFFTYKKKEAEQDA